MDIERILSASVDKPESILDLPYPTLASIGSLSAQEAYQVCRKSLRLWKDLLVEVCELELDHYEIDSSDAHGKVTLEGDEVCDYLLLIIAAYYDLTLKRFMSFDPRERSEHPPGLTLQTTEGFLPVDQRILHASGEFVPLDLGIHPKNSAIRIFCHRYFSILVTLYMVIITYLSSNTRCTATCRGYLPMSRSSAASIFGCLPQI